MLALKHRHSIAYATIALMGLSWGTESALAAPCDKQAPTSPGALSATGITSGGFVLSWSLSTDNVGVSGFEIETEDSQFGSNRNTAPAFRLPLATP